MELNFDITKKPLSYEEIKQFLEFKEKNYRMFVKFKKDRDMFGKEREYFYQFYNSDFNDFERVIKNDTEHKELLTKLFNKYVKITKINDTVKLGKDYSYETFLGYSSNISVSYRHFKGYHMEFNIPEFWKGYITVLDDKLYKEKEYKKVKTMLDNVESRKRFEKMVEELEK